ncbi:hypothetical protein N7451_012069 [Penicillium sp. IBT 35674x]|nr:hypothetical protein N7451_012069 [Penicillium sp. IBT 35674x]
MTASSNLSLATMLAAREARLSIDALTYHIKATRDAPGAFTDLVNQLSSLKAVVTRLSLACGYSLATASDEIEAHVRSLLVDCEKTCDRFAKALRGFVDRSVDGTTCSLNRDLFGVDEELEVQSLSKRIIRWKDVLSSMIDPSLPIPLYPSENVSQESEAELLVMENGISNMIEGFDEDEKVLQDILATLDRKVRQIKGQATEIHFSRELLDRLRLEVHWLRTGRRIDIEDGGRLRVGVLNYPRHNNPTSSFHNVHVSNDSRAAIGVFDNLNVNDFFGL